MSVSRGSGSRATRPRPVAQQAAKHLAGDGREKLRGARQGLGAGQLVVQPARRVGLGEEGVELEFAETKAILTALGGEAVERTKKRNGWENHRWKHAERAERRQASIC